MSAWSNSCRWLVKQIAAKLASLRLAIVLLLIIALFSISGTVIEQGQTLDYYRDNYPEQPALFGFLTWKVLLAVGLNNVYRTWWYLGLLIFFGASLATCTMRTQLPALKSAQKWRFYDNPKFFQRLALSATIEGRSLTELEPILRAQKYQIRREENRLYARKGIVGKIGPIVVHAGMLIVLIGGSYGALSGFMAQELVTSGNTFKIHNIIDAGPFSQNQIPQDWSVKVDRFWIDYTPQGDIDQFYSTLTVLDDKQAAVKQETIYVNKPLKYRGVTLYQTNWAIAALKVRLNDSPIFQLPMAQLPGVAGRLWGTWLPTKPDLSEGVSLIAKDLQGTVLIYDTTGKLLSSVRTGGSTIVNGINLQILELIGSTGLQIKADPGIPIVYTGFALLMAGVVMSYFSHSQIWAFEKDDKLYLGGRTNRAQIVFERATIEVIEILRKKSVVTEVKSNTLIAS
jgi:cytochrome c biogenesis protein